MTATRHLISTLAVSTSFGAGLTISGMTDPDRVRGFLDLFQGKWDPTLAFVMGGAVLVMAVAWRLRKRIDYPLFAERFVLVCALVPRSPRWRWHPALSCRSSLRCLPAWRCTGSCP
jgi:hypothetical protein